MMRTKYLSSTAKATIALQLIVLLMAASLLTQAANTPPERQMMNEDDFFSSSFHSCDSRSTPPRGTYIAISRPCEFIFYATSNADSSSSEGILSDVCYGNSKAGETTRNVVSRREAYAVLWPDECTGNFIRCYNINGGSEYTNDYDEGITMNVTAAIHFMNWTVPEGATQLSVNCTADRAVTEKAMQDFSKGLEDGLEGLLLIGKAIFALTIVLIAMCVYCCCIQPMVKRALPSRRSNESEVAAYEMVDQRNRSLPMATATKTYPTDQHSFQYA